MCDGAFGLSWIGRVSNNCSKILGAGTAAALAGKSVYGRTPKIRRRAFAVVERFMSDAECSEWLESQMKRAENK